MIQRKVAATLIVGGAWSSGIGLTQENWQVYSSDVIDTANTKSYCTG